MTKTTQITTKITLKFPAIIFAATDSAVVTVQLLLSYRAKVKGTSVVSLLNFDSRA